MVIVCVAYYSNVICFCILMCPILECFVIRFLTHKKINNNFYIQIELHKT